MSSIFTPSTELLQLIHTFLVSVWHSHQEGCAQGKLLAANQNEGLDWPIGISHFGWFLLANQVPHSDLTTGEGLYTRTPQSSSITSADHLWPSLTFSDHSLTILLTSFLTSILTVTMAVTLSRSQLVLKKIKFVEGAYHISITWNLYGHLMNWQCSTESF